MKKKLFFLGAILISSLQIQAQNSQYSALACVDGLGGASDPTFLNFEIMGTTLSHETLNPSTVFYHEYPQDGNTTANLQVGHEYSFFTFTSSEAVVGLWVDYNHDNNFDESEFTLLVNSMNSQNYSNFTLSENALPGNTKIRLRTRAYGSTINGQNACTTFGSGETRDYTIFIGEPLDPVCTDNLGGASDPTFLKFEIVDTALSHQTLTSPTVFYNAYPPQGNTTATLEIGQQYSVFTFTSSEAIVGMWIDYNQNNVFEDTEFLVLVNSMASQNYSNFTISQTALLGNTKIRLRTRAYGSTINGQNACTTFGSGETRDYTVNIVENLSVGKFDKVSSSLRVFPNPATEIVTVGKSEEVRQVTLFDVSGKMIASSKENVIDISNYSKGLYIAKVLFVNGSTSVGKIVKE